MTDTETSPAHEPLVKAEATKVLNVVVPASAHRNARVAAAQSGVSMKAYMADLLRKATPIKEAT